MTHALGQEGYEVTAVENGLKAIEAAKSQHFDCIITDLIMPAKEGLETIGELRRDFPSSKVIAISGGGRIGPHEYLNTAKAMGAQKIFAKPVDLQELLAAVREALP